MDMEQPSNSIATGYRWGLLPAAIAVMMLISIYQYSWFLFAYPLQHQLGWSLSSVGLVFTVFNYTSTFIQPFSGFMADSYGPRKVALAASALTGAGLLLASTAETPILMCLYYGIGGLGGGVLYGISTASAVKWFPDRRGFATGLVVFGFGSGTAVFNIFIQQLLEARGLQNTFVYLGVVMLCVLIPLSFLFRYPGSPSRAGVSSQPARSPQAGSYRPVEMLKTRQWYQIYFCFIFTISIVLMFGAQMKMMAEEFSLPRAHFNALLILFPLGNGLSRILAGAISDKIGREKTMVIFYSLLGVSIFFFVLFAKIPSLFVSIVFIASLLAGAPLVLYPAIIGDYYGAEYSTTNYGITYTAKSFAGLISGWLSGLLVMKFGSFTLPLVFLGIMSLLAAAASWPGVMKSPKRMARPGTKPVSY
jgi:OFA family oxalate/formate antiporter-like MFS transporter